MKSLFVLLAVVVSLSSCTTVQQNNNSSDNLLYYRTDINLPNYWEGLADTVIVGDSYIIAISKYESTDYMVVTSMSGFVAKQLAGQMYDRNLVNANWKKVGELEYMQASGGSTLYVRYIALKLDKKEIK